VPDDVAAVTSARYLGYASRVERRAELDATIDADPEDPRSYAVLGDYLQQQGDPRGEIIALELAGLDREARDRRAAHPALTPDVPASHMTWRHGFVHTASVDAAAVATLLAHPSCRFLITLAIDVLEDSDDLETAVASLADRPRGALRELELSRRPPPQSTARPGATRVDAIELDRLWPAVRSLQRLRVRHDRATFRTIDLPALTALGVELRYHAASAVDAIAAASWPALERLELHGLAGQPDRRRLAAVLSSDRIPKLRHLAIRGDSAFRELLATSSLQDSALLRRLRSLDVSRSDLDDAAASRLAALPLRLDKLDVSRNRLTTDGIRLLAPIAVTVNADRQRWTGVV